MKNAPTTPTKKPLGFMTIWLIGWSIGTGALAAAIKDGGAFFFLLFGATQLFVWQHSMQLFVDQAKAMFEAPALSQDLDSMSAAWKSMPHVWGLLLWCSMLGLVVFAILLFGTWAPVRGAETASTFIPMLLTGVWSYPVLKWVQALGRILTMNQRYSVESTLDRLTIKHNGLFLQRDIELPISGLELNVDDTTIHLRSGEEGVAMICPPSPERERLTDNIKQSIHRAALDPFSQPEVPQAIAEMIGQEA